LLHKLKAAEAELNTRAIIAKLRPHRASVHTITADNGKEFALHARVLRQLDVGVYFAKPYHAWECGSNENTNGLVRQYPPKGTSFADITPAAVAKVQNKLNSRPRKVLGYKTPNQVFFAPERRRGRLILYSELNPRAKKVTDASTPLRGPSMNAGKVARRPMPSTRH
jgi:IS30 family transposase